MPPVANRTIEGLGLVVEVDGDDLVVRNTQASNFGDAADIRSGQDNGVGAWGFRYKDQPDFLGCSLPIYTSSVRSLRKSPLPPLPERTKVRIWNRRTGAESRIVVAELIDVGPNGGLNRGIDFLQATVRALGFTMSQGLYRVDYRILKGATFLPKSDYVPITESK
jgi:hypothetical protein